MRITSLLIAAVAATGLLATQAVAQHEHRGAEAAQPTGKPDAGQPGPGSAAQQPAAAEETMCGKMAEKAPAMGEADTGKLIEELAKGFAAIQAETDPAALKTKLAEHGALLQKLQAAAQAQPRKMGKMMGRGDAKK